MIGCGAALVAAAVAVFIPGARATSDPGQGAEERDPGTVERDPGTVEAPASAA